MWTGITTVLLLITGFLLIFIILLQRGRGGGLAGAFSGLGGQSAFGTKAGDIFTKITIVMAICWVILAGVTGFAMRAERSEYRGGGGDKPDAVAPKTGKTEDPAKKKTKKPKPKITKPKADGDENKTDKKTDTKTDDAKKTAKTSG